MISDRQKYSKSDLLDIGLWKKPIDKSNPIIQLLITKILNTSYNLVSYFTA